MQLASTVHGAPTDRPPLVIAHGLYGSGRNWGAIARRLAETRQVVAVDMRNHGDSPRSPEHSYEAMAGDLAATVAGLGGRADLLGHSMGGKAAMVLALSEPGRVRRLIVADIAPVAYGHSQIGYARAMQAVDLAAVRRRADADEAPGGGGPRAGAAGVLPAEPRGRPRGRGVEAEPRRSSPRRCRGSWPSPRSPGASTVRRCS